MAHGPTQGAQERATNAWMRRPWIARAARAVAFVAPAVLAWFVTRQLSPHLWRPTGNAGVVAYVLQLAIIGLATVALAGRLTRRLLPLATLLNLSLVFPDEAPSRFRTALRSGTIKHLEAKLDAARASGAADETADETAARIVEMVAALGRHERLTRGHTERVRAYTDLIAQEMGLSDHDRNLLQWSSFVHDIGKLSVPPEILNKAGRPTDEEWAILSKHPEVGGELVEPLAPWLGEWRLAAAQHHERWDGTGYPNKLAGTEISLAGRIVAVADAYDVITSARSYKKPMSVAAARAELVRCSGTQFDPAVVRALLNVSLGKRPLAAGAAGWLGQLQALANAGASGAVAAAGNVAAAAAVVGTVALGGVPPTEATLEAPAPVVVPTASEQAPPAASRIDTDGSTTTSSSSSTTSSSTTSTTSTSTPPTPSQPGAVIEQPTSTTTPAPTVPPTTVPVPTTPPVTAPPVTAPTTTRAPTTTTTPIQASVCGVTRSGGTSVSGADLTSCRFRDDTLGHLDLTGVNLQGVDLRNAHITFADLSGANLRNVDLRGAVLDNVTLVGADLRGADLRGVTIDGANLRNVDLRGARLNGATFRRIDFAGADFSGATGSPAVVELIGWVSTRCPDGGVPNAACF